MSAGSGVLAEELAVDDALAFGVVEDAADDAVEAADEAAGTHSEMKIGSAVSTVCTPV